jgi:Outer membrane protein beta-barrel domain
MKKYLAAFTFLLSSTYLISQQNMFSVAGGVVLAGIEDIDVNAKGWRIEGVYDFVAPNNKFTNGFSFGYIGMDANTDEVGGQATYKLNSIPICYNPGLLFGEEKFKLHLKGALGWQFSNLKRTGAVVALEDNTSGFALGAGLGGMYNFNEKGFLNFGYEFLWFQNSYYLEQYVSTVKVGVGLKF